MYELIKGFPEQIQRAMEIGERAVLRATFSDAIENIVVSGLGGSGYGGNIVSELYRDNLTVPVICNKSYFLPGFINSKTLLIISSYSGNTEETVSCLKQAIDKGLKPICITSGGMIEEIARKNELDLVLIPGGYPPRACIGYSTVQLFYIFERFGLISDSFKHELASIADLLKSEQSQIMQDAEFLAAKLLRKLIIIYTEDKYESTALRLKQQLNENSKLHAWYNIVPEMNHNELVGWRQKNETMAVLILRAEDEYGRNTQRILFKKGVITELTDEVYEVEALGKTSFEKHSYLIHFGDWLSYHLAVLQGYDPMEIDVLNKLKSHMSGIQ